MGEKRTDFPEADRSPQLQPNAVLHFGAYRLDSQNEQLWRGQQAVRLTGKSFAVLPFGRAPEPVGFQERAVALGVGGNHRQCNHDHLVYQRIA
jgi:hypothetical protein